VARPSKRTPAREQAILGALRVGNTRTAAAAYAEISLDTLARWISDDAEFCGAVLKAEADAEARFLGQIAKAAQDGTWTAAAWWLERRRPENYARKDRTESKVELTGKDGGPIRTLSDLPDHERRILADVIDAYLATVPEEAER
jgi:hypothetical protein